MRRLTVILGLVLSAGCGEESEPPGRIDTEPLPSGKPRELPSPRVFALTPAAAAVGDKLRILGENFVTGDWGHTRLHFAGTFTAHNGAKQDVDFIAVPEFVRTSVVRIPVTGIAPPHGFGDDVGVFVGNIAVVNVRGDGVEVGSDMPPAPATLEILPSLIFEEVRPADSGCSSTVDKTIEGQTMEVSVRAAGLAEPSRLRPIRFTWVYLQPGADISLSDAFALSGNSDVPGVHQTDSEAVKVVTDIATDAPRSRLDRGFFARFSNRGFTTPAVPANGASTYSTFYVEARDADGAVVKGRYDLEVTRGLEVFYDGNNRVVRTFNPVPVSGCISGGERGTEVSYSESTSESRSRSFSVGASVSVGLGIVKDVLDIGFGFNVGGSVSSSESVGSSLSLSGRVLAGQYGVFYRRTEQLVRVGKIVQHGACGGSSELGEALVTDWRWAPDLAFAQGACPPLPPSRFPPGEVFEEF